MPVVRDRRHNAAEFRLHGRDARAFEFAGQRPRPDVEKTERVLEFVDRAGGWSAGVEVMSKRNPDDKREPRDRYEEIHDRARWSEAMLNVLMCDSDVQEIHTTAIAGIAGHLKDALSELEELYKDLPHDGPLDEA